MLHNLLGIAQRTGRPNDSIRYLDTLITLNPDSAADRFSRVGIQMKRGNRAAAKTDLAWLLEHEPPGIDLQRLREVLESL